MDDLPIRLEQFRNAFRPAGGTHGQQIGEESYALRCNGRALSVLAEAADEITRLRAELAEAKKFKDGMLDVLGGACPNDHRSTPFEEFKGCTPCLRAELADISQAAHSVLHVLDTRFDSPSLQGATDELRRAIARK